MVRDGRATVHSIISRHVTITGFDLTSYRQCMRKWNFAIEVMHNQCKEIGKERCMMVSPYVYGFVCELVCKFVTKNIWYNEEYWEEYLPALKCLQMA